MGRNKIFKLISISIRFYFHNIQYVDVYIRFRLGYKYSYGEAHSRILNRWSSVVKEGDHLRQAFPKLFDRHGALITELFEEIWSKLCSESEVRLSTVMGRFGYVVGTLIS